MSATPKPYQTVYNSDSGKLEYVFATGQIVLPASVFPLSFPTVATDPVSPVEGQVWYNTTTHHWRGYDGTKAGTFTFVEDM